MNEIFTMDKDEVMAEFVAYEAEMMDYEAMMAAHDDELVRQWEDQEAWGDVSPWDYE